MKDNLMHSILRLPFRRRCRRARVAWIAVAAALSALWLWSGRAPFPARAEGIPVPTADSVFSPLRFAHAARSLPGWNTASATKSSGVEWPGVKALNGRRTPKY